MANETLTWKELEETCPKETTAIAEFRDEWDIDLNQYLHGIVGDVEWCDVIDICDLRLKISENEEVWREKQLIEECQTLWDALLPAYEEAT